MRATARHSSRELQEKSRALTSREDAVRFQRQREQHDFVAGANRVDGARNRVGERGRNGNDPSLPYRANAERIRARRGIGVHDPDRRNLRRGCKEVVGKRPGQWLPARVVDHFRQDRAANAIRDGALVRRRE